MAEESTQREPRGLGEHARGLASEYAHEQGWGLEQDQRTRIAPGKQNTDGGTDYEYGARDFGDEPVNTAESEVSGVDVDELRTRLQEDDSHAKQDQ